MLDFGLFREPRCGSYRKLSSESQESWLIFRSSLLGAQEAKQVWQEAGPAELNYREIFCGRKMWSQVTWEKSTEASHGHIGV